MYVYMGETDVPAFCWKRIQNNAVITCVFYEDVASHPFVISYSISFTQNYMVRLGDVINVLGDPIGSTNCIGSPILYFEDGHTVVVSKPAALPPFNNYVQQMDPALNVLSIDHDEPQLALAPYEIPVWSGFTRMRGCPAR
jgi:hypothetical protein